MKKFNFIQLIIYILCLSACTSPVFEENVKIDNSIWSKEKPVILQAIIEDTLSPHDVYINIRNAGVYPFSNIFLFVNTTMPHGEVYKDTLEIMLQTPEGKWLGDGLGDIWDNRILFKPNVRFPQKGEYRFQITQAMRTNPLPGIMDVGMRIEKSEKK